VPAYLCVQPQRCGETGQPQPHASLQEEEVAQGKMGCCCCKVLLYVKARGCIPTGGSRQFALQGCEVTCIDIHNSILH